MARGTPDVAATFLERALREPPHQDQRVGVLFQLGTALLFVRPSEAADLIGEAARLVNDPRARAEIELQLVQAVLMTGGDALDICDGALTGIRGIDRELELRLEGARLIIVKVAGVPAPLTDRFANRLSDDLSGATPAEREVLVHLAVEVMARCLPAAQSNRLVDQGLADGRLLQDAAELGGTEIAPGVAINVLIYSERFAEVDKILGLALEDVRRRGSLLGFVEMCTFRALSFLRQGRLRESEAESQAALDAQPDESWAYGAPGLFGFHVDALREQGRLDAADAFLEALGFTEGELPRSSRQTFCNLPAASSSRAGATGGRAQRTYSLR